MKEEADTEESIVNLDVHPKEEAIEVIRTLQNVEILDIDEKMRIN